MIIYNLNLVLFFVSVCKGPGHHRSVPDAGEKRRLCVGRNSGHRHLQQQELAASVRRLRQLCAQVPKRLQNRQILTRKNATRGEAQFGLIFPSYSGIQDEKLILSLEQTQETKPVKKEEEEEQQDEVKAEVKKSEAVQADDEEEEEEETPEQKLHLNFQDLVIKQQEQDCLYNLLKGHPDALMLLAPAAGDTIISLDFSRPGS